VRTGHAPNEITKAAKEMDVDLIVIATRVYQLAASVHRQHGRASRTHRAVSSTRRPRKRT
jgi:hypothetical protein